MAVFFLEKLCKFSPDIIVITGDILDSYRNDMDIVYNILSQLSAVAPCYFVTGNHELRLPKEFEKLLTGEAALEAIASADACTRSINEDRKVKLSEIMG